MANVKTNQPLTNGSTDPTTDGDPSEDPRPANPFPIVGVGASAGGLEAFTKFLQHLPADTGMAFVLVQHLAPDHESFLTHILAKATSMKVEEARERTKIIPNCIYVIPPSKDITISAGDLILEPRTMEPNGTHMPIDIFFRSLAGIQGVKAIGIILSGNGSDGALGLEEINSKGGITIAQAPESAKFDGMPKSAIATGSVNEVLPPEEIAKELARISRHSYINGASYPQTKVDEVPSKPGQEMGDIFSLLRKKTGVDFSLYKRSTLDRRISRRMVLKTIGNLPDYLAYLKENPVEVEGLFNDILIKVTRFFRDPETFEILTNKIFGEIIKDKSANTPIRLWVAGCSTGEEVYSLAICLLEFLGRKSSGNPIQIFGSDISQKALDRARAGTYLENIAVDISPERLQRFFTKANGHYKINKSVRDLCVFAKQNIGADPPFSKLDLISCRNVLIYLNPVLQKKVFPVFHFSLKPHGWLLLGSAETVGSFSELFSVIDFKHRIFAKNANVPPKLNFDFAPRSSIGEPTEKNFTTSPTVQLGRINVQKESDRTLLNRYAPVGVIINDNLEIIQFHGDTSPYFQNPAGEPSVKLLKIAREGLQSELNAAMKEVRTTNAPFRKGGLHVEYNGESKQVVLEVIPIAIPLSTERYWGVMFEEESPSGPRARKATRPVVKRASKTSGKDDANRWKKELESTKAYLESVIEEREAAVEELQSLNEEALSGNEEMQSINEEMQTTKEELQSTNEELTTVNDELHNSNLESLQHINDLNNLLDSVRIPVVMVGSDLKIRRFTPPAEKLLHLMPSDVGRPISDINTRVKIKDLEKMLLDVINNIVIKEQQVQDGEGRWYSIRIHPYKTLDKRIDGAIIVLIDVESMKRTEISITKARDSAEDILATVREPLVVLDSKLRVKRANQSFYQVFQVTPPATEERYLHELGDGVWNIPKLRTLLEEIISKNNSFRDFEVEHDFPGIGQKSMVLNAAKIFHRQGEELILLAIEDITEIKRAGQVQKTLAAIVESSDDAILSKSIDGTINSWNHGAERLFGYTAEEAIGQSVSILIPPNRIGEEERILERVRRGENIHHYETIRRRKDGGLIEISLTISPLRGDRGQIIGASKIARDITQHKQMANELAKKAEDLSRSNCDLEDFAHIVSHDLQSPLKKIISFGDLLKKEVKSALTEKGADYLNHIQNGAYKMSGLISSLLNYSKITSSSHKSESVDMSVVVKETLADLDMQIQEADAKLTVSELPTVQAHPTQMCQLITNLVENAIKYCGKEPPIIDITAKQEGNFWIFSVHDNCIGIDPKDAERIFDIFQRIQTDNKSGVGIGLTICKKIVSNHGGRIWVESEPGKGSTFYFTLPVK